MAVGLAVVASLVTAVPAAAATTHLRVDALAEGLVATGITVEPGRPVTLTATGTASCGIYDLNACRFRDANGSGVAAPGTFVAPGLSSFALIASVGGGPLIQVGTGPTVVTGTGELRLGYNDARGRFFDNGGGFDVTVAQADLPRAARLAYTGPTLAVAVLGPVTLSASITDVDGGPPSGRLDEAGLRFTVRSPAGTAVGSCTAAVMASSATAGTGTCGVRPGDPVAIGAYRVTVELVDDSPYLASPVEAQLRVVAVG